ncbi:MAG: FadR/GntR family transcriptional regulator [Blautia marasmi]
MSNLFEASKRESAVDIVVNSIKQLLMERRLKPGDKLPNELEISEGLGVSRGSVREAMKILSAFGLVDIRVGNGTYVCETPGNELIDSLLFSFLYPTLTFPISMSFGKFLKRIFSNWFWSITKRMPWNAKNLRKTWNN